MCECVFVFKTPRTLHAPLLLIAKKQNKKTETRITLTDSTMPTGRRRIFSGPSRPGRRRPRGGGGEGEGEGEGGGNEEHHSSSRHQQEENGGDADANINSNSLDIGTGDGLGGGNEIEDDNSSSYNLEGTDDIMRIAAGTSSSSHGAGHMRDHFDDEFHLEFEDDGGGGHQDHHHRNHSQQRQRQGRTGIHGRGTRESNSTTPRRRNTTTNNVWNDGIDDQHGAVVGAGMTRHSSYGGDDGGDDAGRDNSGNSSRPTASLSSQMDGSERSLSVRRYVPLKLNRI